MSQLVETLYTVIFPDGREDLRRVNMPEEPGYDALAKLIGPIVDGHIERVNVLDPNRPDKDEFAYTDMFVDEMGHRRNPRPPVNEKATEIYRANWMKAHPDTNPAGLPKIVGVAVLFHRRVWF